MRTQRCYQWWEFAIRAAAIVLVTVWYGALFLLRRLCGAPATLSYDVFPVWARAVLRAAGVRVHIHGAERLDPKANYIFVANHASLFDIPVLLVASPVPVRILYKRQLERVPFLGWALRASTFIAVERERPQTAGKILQQTIASLERDPAALLIFPEGTRSRTGEVGQFRRGAFAIAFASGRAIVPIAIHGTGQILPPTTLRFCGGDVTVRFLQPVLPPVHVSRHDERQWIDQLRDLLLQALKTHATV